MAAEFEGLAEAVTLRPLPTSVEELLTELQAAPRPVAHLRAVYGAATHDTGTMLHPKRVVRSGLGARVGGPRAAASGAEERLARFAWTRRSCSAFRSSYPVAG
ncbi:hypothetical protein SAMN04488074_12786 [Lentzea albidocapillata subsp. violacea]|uniref:Uncharacterized protein n=1 Tax=Lentzea albidocapillata subsp. violacea TaxID=128104 RepID=A0A1G9WEP9_9PSEU|nr:hypothetical protein [Lentzea albidocapillata]SDM82656.1 hypothetical protein SAMN04488074_12786 [Lentzea albidocapillata subsp. violacea]